MITITGTQEETDNVVEMMALAGACDICPGAAECRQHRNDPEDDANQWEQLSCGEVIRHNVKIEERGKE
jgi:hypothetical protein